MASKTVASSAKMAPCGAVHKDIVCSAFPKKRQSVLKWNGWGFKDSLFEVNENGVIILRGTRYELSGEEMPELRPWMEESRGINMEEPEFATESVPAPAAAIINELFMADVKKANISISLDDEDRIFHSHGHTCQEIYDLRNGKVGRCPDIVVYPECHEDVESIVAAATAHNVVVIPFGGGTTVTGAVLCPEDEHRMIVSLDTSQMNKILLVDEDNMTARIQAGVVGIELEKALGQLGFCTGHEPDSYEFSTLGGWVATRASGMKKNVYGNIEDLLVGVKFVTPLGTIEKGTMGPRISSGPDVHHFILGSEGTIGVVTEATLKIRRVPEVREFGSIVFPDFASGVKCMREVAALRIAPASIRMVDNEQFQFGRALKPGTGTMFTNFMDSIKTFYVTKVKGYDPQKLCVATLLFEGSKVDVQEQEKKVYAVSAKYNGLAAGGENGRRGYFLTFVIAYLRDIALNYNFIGESFETSMPWSCVEDLCRNVKDRILADCERMKVPGTPLVSCRVTQTYDAGCCVYFYYGFGVKGISDPISMFHEIENNARDEVLANGGSISHHHGVGKIRKQWVMQTISPTGVEMLKAVKARIDPQNIFNNGNLIPSSPLKPHL